MTTRLFLVRHAPWIAILALLALLVAAGAVDAMYLRRQCFDDGSVRFCL